MVREGLIFKRISYSYINILHYLVAQNSIKCFSYSSWLFNDLIEAVFLSVYFEVFFEDINIKLTACNDPIIFDKMCQKVCQESVAECFFDESTIY